MSKTKTRIFWHQQKVNESLRGSLPSLRVMTLSLWFALSKIHRGFFSLIKQILDEGLAIKSN